MARHDCILWDPVSRWAQYSGRQPRTGACQHNKACHQPEISHLPVRSVHRVAHGRSIAILVDPDELPEVRACEWKDSMLADYHTTTYSLPLPMCATL